MVSIRVNDCVWFWLNEFPSNFYELEIPQDIGISEIFNIVDIYPFMETNNAPIDDEVQTYQWEDKFQRII